MCDFCKNPNTKSIEYTIESANSKIVICPNCIPMSFSENSTNSSMIHSNITESKGLNHGI